jgi:hypothetical protein
LEIHCNVCSFLLLFSLSFSWDGHLLISLASFLTKESFTSKVVNNILQLSNSRHQVDIHCTKPFPKQDVSNIFHIFLHQRIGQLHASFNIDSVQVDIGYKRLKLSIWVSFVRIMQQWNQAAQLCCPHSEQWSRCHTRYSGKYVFCFHTLRWIEAKSC